MDPILTIHGERTARRSTRRAVLLIGLSLPILALIVLSVWLIASQKPLTAPSQVLDDPEAVGYVSLEPRASSPLIEQALLGMGVTGLPHGIAIYRDGSYTPIYADNLEERMVLSRAQRLRAGGLAGAVSMRQDPETWLHRPLTVSRDALSANLPLLEEASELTAPELVVGAFYETCASTLCNKDLFQEDLLHLQFAIEGTSTLTVQLPTETSFEVASSILASTTQGQTQQIRSRTTQDGRVVRERFQPTADSLEEFVNTYGAQVYAQTEEGPFLFALQDNWFITSSRELADKSEFYLATTTWTNMFCAKTASAIIPVFPKENSDNETLRFVAGSDGVALCSVSR